MSMTSCCRCSSKKRLCYECEYNKIQKCPPQLVSDCVVTNSLICNRRVYKIAELSVPIATLGDIISIGPGGVISPLITLTPDINGLVNQNTVTKDMIISTGYIPATVSILGIDVPLQINLPFQQETICKGTCPEDTVIESPHKIESIVTQGIEAVGISVASVLFKVILSTTLTVSRPVITKADKLKLVQDVNENRCRNGGMNG